MAGLRINWGLDTIESAPFPGDQPFQDSVAAPRSGGTDDRLALVHYEIDHVMKHPFYLAAFLISGACLPAAHASEPNTLTENEKLAGWELLFDGESTDGWRNYRSDGLRDGWVVEDGALTMKGGGGDIVTDEQYDAFELLIDYRISEGGNSGIMFHVTETEDTPWMTGPEIQVQDNVKGHDPQKAGWLYQLYRPSPDRATGEIADATAISGRGN